MSINTQDFAQLEKDLRTITSLIKTMSKEFKDFGKNASSAVSALKGKGRNAVGDSGKGHMNDSLAEFSGLADVSGMSKRNAAGMYNMISGGLAKFTSSPSMARFATPGAMGAVAGGLTAAIGNAPKILGGLSDMMPDVGATVGRATNYYNAVMAQGNQYGRASFESATLRGLGKGGLTGPGSDSMVAAQLSGMGVAFSGNYNSTYQRDLRSVGNMARYFNMDNSAATAAVAGLQNGAGSSNLLRNFGVWTSDPRTGKQLKPEQIIGQITGRLTAGRGKFTKKQVLDSLNRGALGASLQNSGLSSDQQQMVVQSLLAQAGGKSADLSSDSAMRKAFGGNKGNANPTDAARNLYSAQSKAMGKGESQYIAGMNAASDALQHLTSVGGELASVFGSLKSAVQTFKGDPVGNGALGVLGGVAGTVGGAVLGSKIAGGANILGAAGSLTKGLNVAKGLGGKVLQFAGSPLGKGLGIAGGVLGVASSGMGAYAKGKRHQKAGLGDYLGGMASGALLGAEIGSIVPGLGTGIGAGIGAAIGGLTVGISNAAGAGGGSGSAMGAASNGSVPRAGVGGENTKPFKLQRPVQSSVKPTAVFGQVYYQGQKVWPNGGHHGIDYPVPEGTSVLAAADGKVLAVNADYNGELGLHIFIQHPQSPGGMMTTVYAHLSSAAVTAGQNVTAGNVIGNSGKTGTHITGAHLHFGLNRGNSTGSAIDPAPYMLDTIPSATAVDGGMTPAGAPGTASAGGTATVGADGKPKDTKLPHASATSNAVTTGVSGISGSATTIAGSINSSMSTGSGSASGTGVGGGEGSASGFTGARAIHPQGSKTISLDGGQSSEDKPSVVINLTIGQASESEARKFAKKVKEYLEEDNSIRRMGRL